VPVAAEHRLQTSRPPLPSKITPPVTRPRVVARPRLLTRLDGALERALALVVGPAGFGKTTLLAEWAVHVGARVAVGWVSLEAGDTGPQRFWTGVLAALQARRPGLGTAALTHLRGGQPAAIEAFLDELLWELDAQSEPLVLVLDDYHFVQSPAVHSGLDYLLE